VKFVVSGGGPAGLYFALLAKQRLPSVEIEVHERNPRDATYGFGIVLADRALNRFRRADRDSYEAISAASFVTRHRIITVGDQSIFVEGGGYGSSIARLRLLNILAASCERAGVRVYYESQVRDPEALDADLIVGAEGVNSSIRRTHEAEFGTTHWSLTNRVAWYGTSRHFPYSILSFKKTEFGYFVVAAYPYTERMSTFVAECDVNTWLRSGLDGMDDEQRQALAEKVFAQELNGHSLVSNKSGWHCLPVIRNRNWHVDRYVLIGDALHSAHPTIGSGTRIAMEDSIALVEALVKYQADLPAALAAFRRLREPQKQKWLDAAEKSFTWYESFPTRMEALAPIDFVFEFLTRTGRVDAKRLAAEYPEFMRRYGSYWKGHVEGPSIRTATTLGGGAS